MNYENKDRELNLKSLLYSLARRWRQMLAAALIMAVAFGAFRGWKSLSVVLNPDALAAQQEAYEASYARYKEQVEVLNTKIAMVQEDIRRQGEYLENSVLMQIDHCNTWLATLSIYVEAEDDEKVSGTEYVVTRADVIADVYRLAVTDSHALAQVAEELNMEVKYLRELISILNLGREGRQEGPLISVVIRGQSAQSVEKTATAMCAWLETMHKEVSQSMGEHTVRVVSCGTTVAVDEDLASLQEDAADRLLSYSAVLETYQESLQQIAAPGMPDLSMTSAVKSMIKYAVVGGLGGLFLVAVWGCVAYVVGDRVYAAEEIKSRFGAAVVGKVSVKARKRCFVDRWLDRVECRGKTEEDGALDVICANVRNHCPAGNVLLVAGTAGDDRVQWIAEALSKNLQDRTVLWGGSLLESIAAIEGLAKCDSVLLVERCGVSRYSLVKNQIEAVLSVDKQLVGCVTLEK